MSYRPSDDRGNLEQIPDDHLLPPELHDEAAAVRKAEERLEDREDALALARITVDDAKRKDAAELKEAVLADKELPTPGAHHARALAALRQAEEAHRIAVSERRRVGNLFVRRMREHRDEIAALVAEQVAPAALEYAAAVQAAAKQVQAASAKASAASAGLTLVHDLDSGERDVNLTPMAAPTPDVSEALNRARRLQEAAESLSTPARPKVRRVRSANGTEMTLPVDRVRDMLRKGELAEEPFIDGLPPEAPAVDPATLPKPPIYSDEHRFGRQGLRQ